jgi:hypothetical protein
MILSKENLEIKNRISAFEKIIEGMHQQFYKYHHGQETKAPDWQRLERELLDFSRRRINDLELSKNLDRVLYKFQNRKKIWLTWLEESHHVSKKEGQGER